MSDYGNDTLNNTDAMDNTGGTGRTDGMDGTGLSSPINMRCKSCGAPAQFDVLKQNSTCLYCGAVTSAAEGLAERRGWQSAHRMKIASDAALIRNKLYTCYNCGAKVMVKSGHAVGKCEFCGGRLVSREYAKSDSLPDIIIPFFITREEALEQVETWCTEHAARPEAKIIKSNMDKLTGYYLPYQMVRGTANAQLQRANCFRKYSCGSFLNGIAVNTSKQLDNLLLDAAEPFHFEMSREFDFTYLENYPVKLQDIDEGELRSRVSSELVHDYESGLRKLFETDKMEINVNTGELLVMAAALPFYLIDCGNVKLAMNAQTGRIAVKKEKVKKSYKYLREPALVTAAIYAVFCTLLLLSGGFASAGEAMLYAALPTLILGMITFTAFTQNRGAAMEDPVLRSDNVEATRTQGRLSIVKSEAEKERPEPVFYEKLKKSGVTPVALRFYDRSRIIKWAVYVILMLFGPWILGSILAGFSFTFKGLFVTAAWLILAVPVTLAMFLQQGRILIYDHPIIYYYPFTGKEIPKDEYTERRDFRPTDIFKTSGSGCMVLFAEVFLIIMFIASTVSVITSG